MSGGTERQAVLDTALSAGTEEAPRSMSTQSTAFAIFMKTPGQVSLSSGLQNGCEPFRKSAGDAFKGSAARNGFHPVPDVSARRENLIPAPRGRLSFPRPQGGGIGHLRGSHACPCAWPWTHVSRKAGRDTDFTYFISERQNPFLPVEHTQIPPAFGFWQTTPGNILPRKPKRENVNLRECGLGGQPAAQTLPASTRWSTRYLQNTLLRSPPLMGHRDALRGQAERRVVLCELRNSRSFRNCFLRLLHPGDPTRRLPEPTGRVSHTPRLTHTDLVLSVPLRPSHATGAHGSPARRRGGRPHTRVPGRPAPRG